jgi:anthranilate phosphoribosyltransferase
MLELMRQIMRGEMSPAMTAAILTGLRVKKETVGEIAAAAQVMREFARKVEVDGRSHRHFVDIVGTGGDGAHTFNISTASMFVAPRPAPRSPSTATAACRRSPAAPTCSKRWAPTSNCAGAGRACIARCRHRLHVRAQCTIRR